MSKSVNIAVRVRDDSSKPLQRVSRNMRRAGKSAEKTSQDFTQFNRTLFTTTAFVGTFAYAMRNIANSMDEAAKMDRVIKNFEGAFGPKGAFISQLRSMTNRSVDLFEAMRAGIELRSLGIITNSNKLAEVMARASAQAAVVGKTSTEGIRAISSFLKDGSVSHLQFLGLLEQSNAALKLQESVLGKYGGVAGSALTVTQRLAIGMDLLRKRTQGAVMSQRDLADTLEDFKFIAGLAVHDIRMLGVAAFAPVVETVTAGLVKLAGFAEGIRKNHTEILFLLKSAGIATAAVAGLTASLGTLVLTTKLLSQIGLAGGIPFLALGLTGLTLAFLGLTSGVEGGVNKLKVFGGVVKGVYQLVSTFNRETGFGKIDSDLKQLLQNNGLFEFVVQISRTAIVVKEFTTGLITGFKDTAMSVINYVGDMAKKILLLFGIDSGPWSGGLLDTANNIGKTMGKATVAVLGLVGAFKLVKGLKSAMGGIGGLFSGGAGKPKGTPTSPLYVKVMNAFGFGGAASTAAGTKASGMGGKILSIIKAPFVKLGGFLGRNFRALFLTIALSSSNFVKGVSAAVGVLSKLRSVFMIFSALKVLASPAILQVAAAAAVAYTAWKLLGPLAEGIYNNWQSVKDLGTIIYGSIMRSVDSLQTSLSKTLENITSYTKRIFSTLGYIISKMFEKVSSWFSWGGETLKEKLVPTEETVQKKAASQEAAFLPRIVDSMKKGQKPEQYDIDTASLQSPEDRVDTLKRVARRLEGEQKDKFAAAMQKAQEVGSESGIIITKDEFRKIFDEIFTRETDKSIKAGKEIAEGTKPVDNTFMNAGAC